MHLDLDQPTESDIENAEKELFFTSDQEARITMCLAEKQMTTPDNYPLTLNSVCLACNQKSNREPVMNLMSGDVLRCLRSMEDRSLVVTQHSGRTEKFGHRVAKQLGLEKAELSLLTVLVLRGPQTLSELKTRTSRMFPFEDLDDVELALVELIERDSPLVKSLGKLSGQREGRYAHLLRGDVQIEDVKMPSTRKSTELNELKARIIELENEVEALKAELANAPAE